MTTAKRVKDAKIQETFQKARDNKEPKPKFSTRRHNRCKLCGRPRAFLRKFGICRLVFPAAGVARGDSRGFEVVVVGKRARRGDLFARKRSG